MNGWLWASVPERPMLPRGYIVFYQRRRIFDAAVRLIAAHGYGPITVADLTKEAQASRNTLYENFGNREEIFLGAFDEAAEELLKQVKEAAGAEQDWRRKVEAGLSALLGCVASKPLAARAFMVEPLRGIPVVKQRYREVVEEFVSLLEGILPRDERSPRASAEMLVGGVASIVYLQVSRGEAEAAPELLPELTRFVLEPFAAVGP